jgi:hypothetical protein
MKYFATLLLAAIGFMAQAQNEPKTVDRDQIVDMPKRDIMKHGPQFVQDIKIRECYVLTNKAYWQAQLKQPTQIDEQPNGTMPLSEELPFVHTLRGATYTYDHLRYTVR